MQIYFIADEKDLAYGEIRTQVWQDKFLQSKRASTELVGPGFLHYIFSTILFNRFRTFQLSFFMFWAFTFLTKKLQK